GAASGLGRDMALTMTGLGATVVLCDINEKLLEKAVSDIQAKTGRAVFGYPCDISDRHAVYATAEKVKDEVGSIDILVNNAGIVSGDHFLNLPDEKIELTFGVNSLALFWTAKAFLPDMLERGQGHIVTVASAAGLVGTKKLTDYCASKFAAVGFNESLRMELRQRAPGIKTTVVCPYYIDTGMFEGVKTRFSWLLPILKPSYVISKIITAIESNQAELIMPRFVKVLPLARMLPTEVFDFLSDLIGVNACMDTFKGRAIVKNTPKIVPTATQAPQSTPRKKRKLPIAS
ncbi:MAG: SDR family oxidoreductase, partial [Planctomycetota bacterium]|nr:SDR family oxidoreductase [Planctomycetota bacterium]